MYFYVFLQPEIFEEAQSDGEDALSNIAAILRGFLQNCFIAVFEDDRWSQTVKDKLDAWPETELRKRVKTLLAQFKKRNRILYNIYPDYEGITSDLECACRQAEVIPLDLILVVEKEFPHISLKEVEVSTRRRYQLTAFEPIRSDLAVDGRTCAIGEMEENDFMQFHFAKALKYATFIHICDRVCGQKNFKTNFRYTTKRLLTWLGGVLADPSRCKIIFHMGKPVGQGAQFILDEISYCKNGRLSKTTIEINFYNESLSDPTLPHQRFILTDQIALDVDRGLDFIDRNTHKCRDTYVNYQKTEEANKLLRSYSSGRLSSHQI